MLGRRLADDAHEAWKWGSIRFLALGGVVEGALAYADRTGLSAHLPNWLLMGAATLAFGCLLASGYSRVTTKDCPNDRPGQPS